MRLTFDLDFYNPFWEGLIAQHNDNLEDCRVRVVERKVRFYWPKLQWRMASRCICTYVATDIGEFWVWDKFPYKKTNLASAAN